MKTKLWIIAVLIVSIIHFAVLFNTAPRYTEADMEAQWSDGYTQYQIDRYIPKPDHKAPDSRLKAKVNG